MKFSQFRAKQHQIQETTLNDEQLDRVDMWDHHANVTPATKSKIDTAFGTRDFTHFPLTAHHEETHDPDVIEHLVNHGYEVTDYKKGIVSKHVTVGDPERGIPHRVKRVEEKIGSVLNKTAAPDHIKKAYVNDPSRTLKTGGIELGHHVVISTHPAAIGGMSTGTPWRSCMNMDEGVNRHYLRHESENGTHIAFLVRHDDPTAFKTGLPTHPISRIALKAFHNENEDGERDTVYRPEHTHYGARTDGFHMAVNNWAEKNYPAKHDETYNKAEESYDDDGISKYRAVSKIDVLDKIDSGHTSHRDREALQVIPHEIAHEAVHMVANKLKSVNDQNSFNAARNSLETLNQIRTLTPSHIALLRHAAKVAQPHGPYNLTHGLAMSHGDKFSTRAIEEDYTGQEHRMPSRVLGNVKLPEHMVDKLEVKDYGSVRGSKIKPHHIDKVVDYINNNNGSSFNELASKFTADHLHKLIDGNRWGERNEGSGLSKGFSRVDSNIANYPAFNQEHHDKLLDHYVKAKYPDEHGSDMSERLEKISHVLRESKFAKFADIAKVGRRNVNGILDNHIMPKEEQVHLKNAIMNDVGSDRDEKVEGSRTEAWKYTIGSKGGVDVRRIPHHIGELMDNSDYSKLAEHGKVMTFGNSLHNQRMLDAHWKHAQKLDSEINDHVDKMREKHGDDYEIHDADDYDDIHGSKLLDHFHKHMESYASQIDNHLDHALNDADIVDHNAHEMAGIHLDNANRLENYKTPENTSHYRYDHDHYDNHFQEIKDRHENAHDPEVHWDDNY